MSTAGEQIIGLYDRHAEAWDRNRSSELIMERVWIERFVNLLPACGSVLDLGCGTGQPLARHLLASGFNVVGVDSSPALIAKCRNRFPDGEWLIEDMRKLSLNRRFNGLLAWDSFFHLSHASQREMFHIFQKHTADGAALMFTSGPAHGEAMGTFEGEPLYHASLADSEYRSLLDAHGFNVMSHVVEDPDCGGHTIWLAQKRI